MTPEPFPSAVVRSLRAALAAACFLAAASAAPAQEDLKQVFTPVKTKLNTPNEVLVADIVHTDAPELVVTDVEGKFRVYDAGTGAEIGAINFGKEHALTGPIVGDFLGRNRLDIAFGTKNGEVIVVDGATYKEIARQRVSAAFSIQPTVITRTAGAKQSDLLAISDNEGNVHGISVTLGRLAPAFEARTKAKFGTPLSVGKVRGGAAPDLVGGTVDGSVVLISAADGSFEVVNVQQDARITNTPLTVDLTSDGNDEVVVATDKGELICVEYRPNDTPRLKRLWSARIADPVGPPLLVRKGEDLRSTRIVQLTAQGVVAVNPFDNPDKPMATSAAASGTSAFNGATTAPALIPRPNNYPELAFGVSRTVVVTAGFGKWLDTRDPTAVGMLEAKTNMSLSKTPAVFAGEDKILSVIGIGTSTELTSNICAFGTGFVASQGDWPTRTPWMTLSGSPYHNPHLDKAWARLERDRRDKARQQASAWENELKAAMDAGEWQKAEELASELADFDPFNKEYGSNHFKVSVRKNLILIVVVGAAIIFIVGYTSLVVTRLLGLQNLRRRAEAAVGRGEFDEARRHYIKLYQKSPKKAKVALALAKVFAAQRDYSEETIAIYGEASAAAPDDRDLLHAYVRALLLEPKTTQDAASAYEKAITSFPEPELLEYGLGRFEMARGNWDEAAKRLRSAIRNGQATDQVYAALCDVYLKTRNFGAKSLPVFQQQFPVRREDKEFLEAYVLSCIDAKKLDAQVESLCQTVLDYSPNFVPAYLHLAQIYLQKSQVGAAIEEVRQASKIDPNNEQAIAMLAQCFLMQNRRDEEAVQAFRRALASTPRDRELLRTLASIYFDRGTFDEDAVRVYRASAEENPNDATTLKALAQYSQLSGEHDLGIRSIESLLHMGQMNQKLTIQLANAYVKRSVQDPKTEKVFREALRAEPNNADFVSALARVLVAQDRTDIDCLPVYEAHVANSTGDLAVGRQLAKAYIKADRFDNAFATAQKFLKIAPNDEELQRLRALAGLYDNKIDEAVSEYQRILERNPNDKEALLNLALAYGQKHRTDDEARALYERALSAQPNNDLLHMAMARVHAAMNDAAAAVEDYKKAIKARASNEANVLTHLQALLTEKPELLRLRWFFVEVLVAVGRLRDAMDQLDFILQHHQGQQGNVLKALETILAKDPQNVAALILRGNLLLAAGQASDAIRIIEKAHSLNPSAPEVTEKLIRAYNAVLEKKEDPDVRFKLGRIYYVHQDFDQAIGCFQKTASDYRWEAESTKMLGRCFVAKGMLDLALQEYKKLVVDNEVKEMLYDLAQRYEAKRDLVGAKTVYRQLFAADIEFKDVKTRFEMLSGQTSDPAAFEKTSIVQAMGEDAARRYELLDELGRGAMGIVYRAKDRELDEIVALKILPDNLSNNPEAVRRFKIEARNARRLSHPNIVRIHDIGEEMGRKYISMEYVDGSDLKKKIRTVPDLKLPLDVVVRYVMAIADALGYAHRLGIVHRDIKPANIMLTGREEVKITDFGIAKLMDQTGEGTMMGAVIGTPLYMSPEQVQGIPVDNRADIYAFGVMFYELVNGRPPFTEGDLAYQHIHREPPPIQGCPEPLWEIISKCLAKRKEDRWVNAEAVYEALREFKKQFNLP